jgi:mRNA interferase RelE/StbE
LSPDIKRIIRRLHPHLKSKIRSGLEEIQENPYCAKPLRDQLQGLYSYRVNQFRIIYKIHQKLILIEVLEIAKRNIVYEQIMASLNLFKKK